MIKSATSHVKNKNCIKFAAYIDIKEILFYKHQRFEALSFPILACHKSLLLVQRMLDHPAWMSIIYNIKDNIFGNLHTLNCLMYFTNYILFKIRIITYEKKGLERKWIPDQVPLHTSKLSNHHFSKRPRQAYFSFLQYAEFTNIAPQIPSNICKL